MVGGRVEQAATPIDHLFGIFSNWLYLSDPGVLWVTLGALVANRLAGVPVWLLLVGPPASGKSEILESLSGVPRVFPTSTLTEAALLSGVASSERADEAKGGLLMEIGAEGIIVFKDFTSVLEMNRDGRRAVLAALREVYDGHWVRRLGTDGGTSFEWRGRVGLLMGCTPIIDKHHAVMSAMGERFITYRIPELTVEQQAAQLSTALNRQNREAEMRIELGEAVSRLVSELPSIKRAPVGESDLSRISALAMLSARCRSAVHRDSDSREIELRLPPENPNRLGLVLRQLLQGLLAIGLPKDWAWMIVCKVGLDGMPAPRRAVFDALLVSGSPLPLASIAERAGYRPTTARRRLEDLQEHGIVERVGVGGHSELYTLTNWARHQHSVAQFGFPEMSPVRGDVPGMSGNRP